MVGAETPFEQYGVYASTTGGLFLALRSLFRSHHALKAIQFAPNTEERFFHSFLAKATEEQLRHAHAFAYRLRTRGILGGLLLPTGFLSYLFLKHKK